MDQYENNRDYTGNNQNYRPVPPKTWLLESILVTVFCCLPFGIVGIVKAASIESAFYAGRVEEAERLSRDAKKWTIIGFWTGLAAGLIYFVIMIIAFIFGDMSNAFTLH